MPTYSDTYNFAPPLSNLTLAAFNQIGIKPAEIVAEHMKQAEIQSNLLLCQWSSLQPNLWVSELKSEDLTEGTATYILDPEIVAIQLAYISTTIGSQSNDRSLGPMSTVEYAAQPNKTVEGFPTSYWFNRQITPEITMWPVPDGIYTYTLKLRCVRQVQDASMPNGLNVEIPYRFNTAFVDGLAHRLGITFPQAAMQALGPAWRNDLMAQSKMSWDIAASQDTEPVSLFISPMFGGYAR